MLDIGWSELLVIGVLALLVVGPKELPGLFRTVGRYVGQARSVAREFQRSMEDAARDADGGAFDQLKNARRDFERLGRVDYKEQARRSQAATTSSPKPAAERATPAPTGTSAPAGTQATPEPTPARAQPAPETPSPDAAVPSNTGADRG
ncbi:MAG: Sec-independent protein translocase protein TatB [Paracoccaceae bacterium]